jgi:hypothetical protein
MDSFQVDCRRFMEKQRMNAKNTIRATIVALHQGVTMGTRVDTGRARGDWKVELNSINRDVSEPRQNGTKGPPKGTPPTSSEISASGIKKTKTQVKVGDDVFISNSLPYIGELEEKDHMVAVTIKDAVDRLASGGIDND